MKIRKSLLAALCVASMGAITLPVTSSAAVYFDVAPPAPRVEVVPRARAGHVWVHGHWNARGHRHAWHRGHWVRARYGHTYMEPRWRQDGNRWQFERGRWARADRQR